MSTNPAKTYPNESDAERLVRLQTALAHQEAKSGRHAGELATWYRREVIKLQRKIAEAQS